MPYHITLEEANADIEQMQIDYIRQINFGIKRNLGTKTYQSHLGSNKIRDWAKEPLPQHIEILDGEIFKPYPRDSGYCVSTLGRVVGPRGWILSTYYDNIGYQRLHTRNEGVTSVHRMVAITFIPNPDNLPDVNHKDENKANNRVENLEWVSTKYNMNYGTLRQRMSETIKTKQDFHAVCRAIAEASGFTKDRFLEMRKRNPSSSLYTLALEAIETTTNQPNQHTKENTP